MRQRWLPWLLAFVLLVGSPAAAQAGEVGFWWWWDSLSGPGPFKGLILQQVIHTWQKKKPEDPSSPRSYFDPSGLDVDWNRRYMRLGVEFGVLFAEHNNLEYAPPQDGAPPDVRAIPIMATFDVMLVRSLEVGTSAGWVRFSAGEASSWKVALEPRVIWRPLVLTNVSKNQKGLLELRLFGTGITQTIRASDFGAIGGMEPGREWLPGFLFTINALALKP